jgi:predicted nucleotide-binding protein (sugar kinase/HSP70/actin superfamily)
VPFATAPFWTLARSISTSTVRTLRPKYYECGMDQPTYTPVQQIVELSGTLFFSFQDLDSTKPAGSVKIRVETIAHYLERYAGSIIEKKKAAMAPDCRLSARAPGVGG